MGSRALQAVVVSLAVVALTAPVAAGGTPSVLDRVILRAPQVGKGYALKTQPNGRKVQGVTSLALCGFPFPSEQLRLKRLQINFVRGGAAPLSNQVVTYRSGGAQQALRELSGAASRCLLRTVHNTYNGVPITYRVRRFSGAGLLPGYVALRVRTAFTASGRGLGQTMYAVYQARGPVLSSVFAYGAAGAVRQLALHAAEASAANLKRSP